jgi:hypothetical protein
MSTIERYIEELENNYPESLLDATDLQKIGIGTLSTLSKWRSAGKGPPFFKLTDDASYKYLKSDVILWLRSRYTEHKKEIG